MGLRALFRQYWIWGIVFLPCALVMVHYFLPPYHYMRWTLYNVLVAIGVLNLIIAFDLAVSKKKPFVNALLALLLLMLPAAYLATCFFSSHYPPYLSLGEIHNPAGRKMLYAYPLAGMIGYYFPWSIWVYQQEGAKLAKLAVVGVAVGMAKGLLYFESFVVPAEAAFYSLAALITALVHWGIMKLLEAIKGLMGSE